MTNQIKLKIDGIEVAVEKGQTILEAAQAAGVPIPTLCHDRRLVPFGACRVCVVEQKGKSELLASCFTPAQAGMEILTRSPKVVESRKLQLQFILLNHPMICPRCEKEGECVLQQLVYEYGVEETRYPWEKTHVAGDDFSPLLQRNADRCILCGRCVRICDEVQGVGELAFANRGIRTSIDTDFHRPLDCEFCGQCLDTCPVGAITSDRFDTTAKVWELTETTTPCPYCGCGCLLTIGSKEGQIKRVFSDPGDGPPPTHLPRTSPRTSNDGNLCVKGRFGWDFVDHPERLRRPLLRVDGSLKEVSWEEALGFVANELESLKDQSGAKAIAGMVSSRLTNEEYFLFQRLFRSALGTDQIVSDGGDSDRGLAEGLAKSLGLAASTNSIREIREADCLLVIGTNPAQTHPIIKNEIHLAIRKNRAQLVVIGSRDTRLTRASHVSPLLRPALLLHAKPGTEIQVLNRMIHAILKEGLEDKNFIEARTEGIGVLRAHLSSLVQQGSENDDLSRAAKAFGQAGRAMILIGSGAIPCQGVALASSNLALLTGHIGKPSCGILLLLDRCNSQGAMDLGVFSQGNGRATGDVLKRIETGQIKALYAVGKDLLTTHPYSDRMSAALGRLRLLVVQDLFMTETAKHAHVVLPACAFVEKPGTFTNLERRIQKLHPIRAPLGESRSDFAIFLHLLRHFEWALPGDTPEAIFEEIGRHHPHYQGLMDGEPWPNGLPYLYGDGFPGGKARLVPVSEGFVAEPSKGMEAFPFQMVLRTSLFQSGLLGLRSEALGMVSERPLLEMRSEDARALGLDEGEWVQVSDPEGRTLRMPLKLGPILLPGMVTAPAPCPLIGEGGISWVKVKRSKKQRA